MYSGIYRGGSYIKKIGQVILGLSIFLLIGTGLYYSLSSIFQDSSMPVVVRVGIIGVILGLIILLYSLIKERMEDLKDDNSEY
ncbi:hypothetical protein GM661_06120 [Iocasia frigidifontis]|uniref:Uncharacterized protein n=1 Tax=Iocasia fonsfrigidae TaxID=2682810 RepID=A0A8A7KDA6_9FIRM|nr:hypothetical protein [Iocasia fonsfrigidae]QTL97588.1 hypothetical protein GM661_06120 [Iocasia fonsfrigidae]